jgi:hypothetical protein
MLSGSFADNLAIKSGTRSSSDGIARNILRITGLSSKEAGVTQSKTERARYVFAVKEFADGTPWIMLEQSGEGLDVIGDGFMGFDLKEGTSLKEAEKLAELLRQGITTVSYTSFTK